MSRDPFQQLRSGDRIPRSVRAWRELVDVAREVQAKRSGLPAEPASSTDFFPNLTVNVRNQSGAQMIAGELVKVFPPETMGATPAGNKLLNAPAIFPAVKPDASTSSYARLLETIGPGLVGKAAVLGWLGSGSATVKAVSRRAPSQRFYAGSSVVGVPYLNTAYWETFVTTYGASQPVPVPFVGLPYNLSSMPAYLPGLESFQATAAERAGGQPLALIQSRYRQQFRGVVRLLFSITRYRSPLKDSPTGRTIGFGYPGLTLNARVESTRLGQVEPLSGTSSTTINPLWMSRHPVKFTVGEFDANFNDFYLPGQALQNPSDFIDRFGGKKRIQPLQGRFQPALQNDFRGTGSFCAVYFTCHNCSEAVDSKIPRSLFLDKKLIRRCHFCILKELSSDSALFRILTGTSCLP